MQDKYDGIAWYWNDLERRDTYPSGLFGYLYGGAFSQFLTKVYGDEVYAKFLRMHPKWFTTRNFKLAFGKSITELFNAFLDTIPLPENCFEPEQLIKKRSLYSALASDNNTVFYADNNEGTIFSLDVKTKKIKKLFNINNSVYNLSISSTGILAVSYFYSEHGSSLSKVILYDVHNQKILSDQYSSLRYASISPDEKNICGVRVVGQTAELVLIDRKTKTEKILLNQAVNTQIYTKLPLSIICDMQQYFHMEYIVTLCLCQVMVLYKNLNCHLKAKLLAKFQFYLNQIL